MSFLKLGMFIVGIVLFLFLGIVPSFAEQVKPDFSFLDDDEPPKKPAKSNTAAGVQTIPCITCTDTANKKSIRDGKAVAEATKAETQKKTKSQTPAQIPRITGGTNDTLPVRSELSSPPATSWSQFPDIANYSNSPQVVKMIRAAETNKERSSQKNCYRYVKGAMCGMTQAKLRTPGIQTCAPGSLVSRYPRGAKVFEGSNNAIKTLKAEGFKNLLEDPRTKDLIKNPSQAPKGAILVYTGGYRGGHIEIKTGEGTKGSYISDFPSPASILQNELRGRASKNYKLVGVMVKPMENP